MGIRGFMEEYEGLQGYRRVFPSPYNSLHVPSYSALSRIAMENSISHLYEGEFLYHEITSDWWNIPWYITRKCFTTILFHAIVNTWEVWWPRG